MDKRGTEKARELSNMASALWALNSNAQQHEFVRKAVDNLEDYTQRVPADANAARMLDAIRNDKVETKVLKPTP